MKHRLLGAMLVLVVALTGCGDQPSPTETTSHKYEHKPPHGGTPVVLGHEEYHLELVRDAAAGKLTAFVMDGELENFVRLAQPEFEIRAVVGGRPETLKFLAVANAATGEKAGDTSQFEATADWLKNTAQFDAELVALNVRGTAFTGVKFNFPGGNDTDAAPTK